jgi:hypothetical protein
VLLGNVPLIYLLSNNPMGSGTLPPSLLPKLQFAAQLVWTQAPIPELGSLAGNG